MGICEQSVSRFEGDAIAQVCADTSILLMIVFVL
jgi:hypothetical protein